LLLANQTVKLDLTGHLTDASCDNDDVVDSLVDQLISYLNQHASTTVKDMDCEFIVVCIQCKSSSVEIKILLICVAEMLSDDLVTSTKQQKAAIKRIMNRKTSEHFTVNSVKMTVRLFSNSEQRKASSPSCAEDCSQVEKGQVTLCNCTCKLTNYKVH